MRAPALALLVLALGSLVGCGAAAVESPAPRAASVSPLTETWISAPREVLSPAPAKTLVQRGTILIGDPAPPPAPVRPRSRGRANVSFHRADLENAMRFLADSGRFNLVVESGLSGMVTASLRDVDAYDALVMIAHANGADVQFDRGIVMVRKATATR